MSDLIVCKVSFLKNSTLTEAYRSIEVKKKNYLLSKGISAADIIFSAITIIKISRPMQTEELGIICLLDLP
jgi:hypothetical protein